jgi:1-acyl-sn-glycerol-3-phosphate acyltransferase
MHRVFFAAYKWIVLVPVVGVSTALFGGLCLVLCLVTPPATAGRWCGRAWARVNAVASLMRVDVEGEKYIEGGRSYVVTANHQSQLDILVIYGWLDMDFRWVMKKELRKVPVLGVCCEKLGHIFVDRTDRTAAIEALNSAKENIGGGTSIFFFPEGTRSRNGKMLPFKKGAFRMAAELQLPVLPVSITGTHTMLPPGSLRFRPGAARLVIHPPIETVGRGPEQVSELIRQARETIASKL